MLYTYTCYIHIGQYEGPYEISGQTTLTKQRCDRFSSRLVFPTNALQSLNKTLHTSQALSAESQRSRFVQLITTEWRGAVLCNIAREEECLPDRLNELR